MFKFLFRSPPQAVRSPLQVTTLEGRDVPASLTFANGFGVTTDAVVEGNEITFRVIPKAHTDPAMYYSELGATYEFIDGTAKAGSDYVSHTGLLQWAPTDRSARFIKVQTNDDIRDELTEQFTLRLAGERLNPLNQQIVPVQQLHTGTIQDNDAPPKISIANASSVLEGHTGTKTMTFVVSLSAPSDHTIKVVYTTVDGTATTANNDYVPNANRLTFAPGETQKLATVTINGDTLYEADETLRVQLSSPTNATILNGLATGTILNDEVLAPLPQLTINNVTVAEGTGGTKVFRFAVTLSAVPQQTVSVQFTTANGTATTADSDYVGKSGTLSWAVGASGTGLTKYVDVTVNGDNRGEGNEQFTVQLTGATNATIQQGTGVGTILNDDSAYGLSVNDVSMSESNGHRTYTFNVTLNAVAQVPVSVQYRTEDGSATVADNDYQPTTGTLTWNVGESGTKAFSVIVVGDTRVEETESFHVVLFNAVNAAIVDGTGTGTIGNDDSSTPTLHDKPVVYRNGGWYFDLNGDGGFEEFHVNFGLPGDTPLLVDWDGNNIKDLTVVRKNHTRGGLDWYIDLNRDGGVDQVKQFGLLGDTPLAAETNGDGRMDMIAVRSNPVRGGLDWYIDLDGQGVWAEATKYFGLLGDVPTTGDWNGDGLGDMGIVRTEGIKQYAYLDYDGLGNAAEERRLVASVGEQFATGDWNGDGRTDFVNVAPLSYTNLLSWNFDVNGDTVRDRIVHFGLTGDIVLAGQ